MKIDVHILMKIKCNFKMQADQLVSQRIRHRRETAYIVSI